MASSNHRGVPARIERIRDRLECWRASRVQGARIPEALWEEAARVAVLEGISRVSRETRLGYYGLRRRVEQLSEETLSSSGTEPVFVDVELTEGKMARSPSDVEIELDNGRGGKMRVRWSPSSESEVMRLSQSLWSQLR